MDTVNQISVLAEATVAPLISPASRRVYALRLREFIASGLPLTREGVASHLIELRNRELSAATINQARAAIRKLVDEALARELISERDAGAIKGIKGDPIRGVKAGNWLSLEGVKGLLLQPDRNTPHGCRDAALLATMIGCGLRRKEACELDWSHYQEREGRMCFLDIKGKGGRVRTVPIPEWARRELDCWLSLKVDQVCENLTPDAKELAIVAPLKRKAKPKNPALIFQGLTPSGVWWIVKEYGEKMGIHIRPHDLRRTLARLMKRAGVDLEQIACTLGHAHLETTRIYLGGILELGRQKAGVDQVKWEELEATK